MNTDSIVDPRQPMLYQIRLKGHLNDQWTDWFDGLAITQEANGDTILTGAVTDQAALHGVLKKVRDVGMPLLSVNRIESALSPISATGYYAPSEAQMQTNQASTELERSVSTALATYSNVHRGSGHNSLVSTRLYEQARAIVLEHLGLSKDTHVVIFCTPMRAAALMAQLAPEHYRIISSQDIGLPLGVRALAVDRKALPKGAPSQSGGGTARLVAPSWVIWSSAPDKFEPGTPAIVNVIAFAKALRLLQQFGPAAFQSLTPTPLSTTDILYHDELTAYTGKALLDQLRMTLLGREVLVPTVTGATPFINLDNGASTPTFAPIWHAVTQTWHQPTAVQHALIRETKSICAEVLGAPQVAYDVLFTANTTEAINLVVASLGKEREHSSGTVVVNTLLEHNSNELPWRTLPGCTLLRLTVDAEGFVDLAELETLLSAYNQDKQHGAQRIKLVAVSGASNVLGTCNDLAEISRIVHRYGACLLVDAAQLVAHRKIDMQACYIDYLAFSAHKAYAPFGTGVLVARKGLLHFNTAELAHIQSSGEENAGGIVALGKALLLLQRIGLDLIQAEEQALTARALRGLAQIPGLTIYGIQDPDAPSFAHKGGVITFNLKDLLPNHLAEALAVQGGIGVRYGCHCAHLLVKRVLHIPPLLEQFQGLLLTLFRKLALPGVVRVSLGIENTADDIDTLLDVLNTLANPPKTAKAKHAAVQNQIDDFVTAAVQSVYFKTEATL